MTDGLLQVGQRLAAETSGVNAIVLTAPKGDAVLHCGGEPMTAGGVVSCLAGDPAVDGAQRSIAGVIYEDAVTGLRVRCTRSGNAVMTVDGRPLGARADHASLR